ncbi:MAG TPA: galactokinase family protein [Bryobacteraceae bacterium]|nr:galactokinase family protein [Bryobacteraceae bacterium]
MNATGTVAVPGRVNLIGEHVDYHNLPVLPIAIGRRTRITYRSRGDRRIVASSAGQPAPVDFEWENPLKPGCPGDWANYVKAAAQAVAGRWGVLRGIDAEVTSDLPPAAGLSSSSALLTGVTLALLRANGIQASFEELMEVLPEGEYFVGTRGGGMDHAAVLAGRAHHAVLIHFNPLSAEPVPIPEGWSFLLAHSLTCAEKSGAVRAEYNARRTAGDSALAKSGVGSYREAIGMEPPAGCTEMERDAFLHVTGEGARVLEAVEALRAADAVRFGRLLNDSHTSMRDLLRISTPALDHVAELAREAGALGARLTGAGFGGFVVIFCRSGQRGAIREELMRRHYSQQPGFDPAVHLLDAEASNGALYGE